MKRREAIYHRMALSLEGKLVFFMNKGRYEMEVSDILVVVICHSFLGGVNKIKNEEGAFG
jgi:hypothetical protein